MTRFSQATYFLNILTVKCHFSGRQIRRKSTRFSSKLLQNLPLQSTVLNLQCSQEFGAMTPTWEAGSGYNFVPMAIIKGRSHIHELNNGEYSSIHFHSMRVNGWMFASH